MAKRREKKRRLGEPGVTITGRAVVSRLPAAREQQSAHDAAHTDLAGHLRELDSADLAGCPICLGDVPSDTDLIDLKFTAPDSLSALWASGSAETRAAVDQAQAAAVDAAVQYIGRTVPQAPTGGLDEAGYQSVLKARHKIDAVYLAALTQELATAGFVIERGPGDATPD